MPVTLGLQDVPGTKINTRPHSTHEPHVACAWIGEAPMGSQFPFVNSRVVNPRCRPLSRVCPSRSTIPERRDRSQSAQLLDNAPLPSLHAFFSAHCIFFFGRRLYEMYTNRMFRVKVAHLHCVVASQLPNKTC